MTSAHHEEVGRRVGAAGAGDSIFCPCFPSAEEVPAEDLGPRERRRKDQRL